MSSEETEDIPMAECGACGTIVPLDSESCPNCNIRFGGVSEEQLGECGACSSIIPIDSESCPECGVSFVESAEEEASEEVPVTSEIDEPIDMEIDEANEILIDESSDSEDVEDEPAEDEPEAMDDETEIVDEVQSSDEESEEDDEPEQESEVIVADSEEESSEEEDSADEEAVEDDSEDSEEVSTDEAEDSDGEDTESEESEDEDEEAEEETEVVDDNSVVNAFENLALAIAEANMTAAEAFTEMDTSEDNLIDAPELQKGIEKIGGEKLNPSQVTAILNYLDADENRRIDVEELVKALEDLRIGIKPGKIVKKKKFPSPTQKFLMGKAANDIIYPVMYFLLVTFVGLWIVNGMGLMVDGAGGTVVYEGGVDEWGGEITSANWNLCQYEDLEVKPDPCLGTVNVGESYPCDPALDSNKCANSLTIFSGENGASSMPAGFYGDGIFMIVLGVLGIAGTAYLHLIYAPSLRDKVKGKSKKKDNEDESEDEESDEDEDESDDEDDDEPDDEDDDESDEEDDDESDDEDDDESDDDEDDDEDYDDDIDVGDYIGLEIDGKEYFGEIVEFDDDEGTVTIETDDGDEVTGDQDDMFLEDEDDE